MVQFGTGLSLIQQVAPNFAGVNKQPARIIGRHMDLGEACVKWILFIMNIVVSFAGIGFVVVGVYIKLEAQDYEEFLGSDVSISLMLICVGTAIFLVGGLGCCGANKSSTLFLTLYFLFMLAAIFAQVVVILVILTNKEEVKEEIDEIFMTKLQFYGNDSSSDSATRPFDVIQQSLDCCGVSNGTIDWANSSGLAVSWITSHSWDVPDSCCVSETEDCGLGGVNQTDSSVIFQTGCKEKLYEIVEDNLPVLGGIGGALIGLQLFGACGACLLRRAIEQHFSY